MKKILLILSIYNLLFIQDVLATDGETRTAIINYDIRSSDRIDITAKYTDLVVEAWNENSVQIEATVRYNGKLNEKMQRFLDSFKEEVSENIKEEIGALKINTNLDKPNKFQMGSKHVGIVIDFNEEELKLEYRVKVPPNNSLFIQNSYRDLLLMGDFKKVEIDQYSGELEIDHIENAILKLKYGSASIEQINEAEMELYEQELAIQSIDELAINTKYSDLKIQNMGNAQITSYETDFEIGSVTSLMGTLKYGAMEINERITFGELVTYEFDMEANEIGELILKNSKYGKLAAEKVDKLSLQESYEDDFDIERLGTLIAPQTKYDDFQIDLIQNKFSLNGYEGKISIDQIESNAEKIDIKGKYIDIILEVENLACKLLVDSKYGSINVDKDANYITKYIKDGDHVKIEASYGQSSKMPVISVSGYEMDLTLND